MLPFPLADVIDHLVLGLPVLDFDLLHFPVPHDVIVDQLAVVEAAFEALVRVVVRLRLRLGLVLGPENLDL